MIRPLILLAAGLSLAVALSARDASGDDAGAACNAWDVEYTLSAVVRISDTMFGGGDGQWPIGPGRAVVRFENQNGAPGGNAKLLEYRMNEHFVVHASAVVAKATVTANTVSTTTPNACGVSAEGTLAGKTLKWKSAWSGMHSDGTLTCEGGLCGKFGCPAEGTSPVHMPQHDAAFKSFDYADDRKTFTMQESVVSHQQSPSQTSHVALSGREVKRTCVVAKPCP
jgi:hypothetical protein